MKRRINLTSGLETPAGRLLCDLWYGQVITNLFLDEEYAGYPNNGSSHSLILYLDQGDLEAFFEIISESLTEKGKVGFQELKQKSRLLEKEEKKEWKTTRRQFI